MPEYAHLPFVAEPGSKNKLSKRKLDKYLKNRDFAQLNEHGQKIAAALGISAAAETFNPVIVDFYEQVGYLPDAILNYLLLLGWSLDDKREFFSREEMIASFSLERVTKAPASFRFQETVGVSGPLYAGPAAEAEGGEDAAVTCKRRGKLSERSAAVQKSVNSDARSSER